MELCQLCSVGGSVLLCQVAESLQSNAAFKHKYVSTLSAPRSQQRRPFPVKDLEGKVRMVIMQAGNPPFVL